MKRTIASLLTAALAGTALLSSARNEGHSNARSSTYVLVHGAWQAPYVWDAVRAQLEERGNKVIIVELPAHGADQTATHSVSLDVYRDKVIEATAGENGKLILVGHSMGGMVISAVAEKIPSRISKLVYIGAFLPSNGQALTDLAETDPGSKLGPLLVRSADQLTLDIVRDSLTDLFIKDGTPAVKDLVRSNYRAEPSIPFINKVTLSKENFGSVEKVYIRTLQDIVISPALQDRMIASADIALVYSLNTSHSPFLVQPEKLADMLVDLAQEAPVRADGKK